MTTPAILITCGPASESIDRVRRITNFSTGELGVLLAETFARAGHRVICCKGRGATWPDPAPPVETRRFVTNDDLLEILGDISKSENIVGLYHTAALADFRVSEVTDSAGGALPSGKIPSSLAGLTIHLLPAAKVLPHLRSLFPKAWIVAWKYELEGTRKDVLEKGRRQIAENKTDASILNGAAYGPGFGSLTRDGSLIEVLDKRALCRTLVEGLMTASFSGIK